MRLFGKIDFAINRFDRAQYATPPFDRAFALPAVAAPERTFAAPPRGSTFESVARGAVFGAPPRGTVFEAGQN